MENSSSVGDPIISAILNIFGLENVSAATPASGTPNGGLSSFLPMIVVFAIGIYFLMIRPQSRRVKAHRKLIDGLSRGDEVVTAGGMVGKIAKITNEFIVISIADNVDINIQKAAIANVLPKGTLKSI